MADLAGLLLAIGLAERRRDEAVRALVQCQRNVQSAQSQSEQLRSYAGDTDVRWVTTGAAGLSAELLKHHYQFSGRLEQAIAMQDGVIANLQRHVEGAKVQLQKAECRLSGLRSVLEKRQLEEQRRAQRREQIGMDEMAAQLFARTRNQHTQGDAV